MTLIYAVYYGNKCRRFRDENSAVNFYAFMYSEGYPVRFVKEHWSILDAMLHESGLNRSDLDIRLKINHKRYRIPTFHWMWWFIRTFEVVTTLLCAYFFVVATIICFG